MDTKEKTLRLLRRRKRVRAKISGTAARPRLAVYRSNTQITGQLIDDEAQVTLAAVSTKTQKGATPREKSIAAGAAIAEAAKGKKITTIVFDRGGYLYAGNIKAFADAAREAGLTF
ncbi:50S ribosomal protein L18 [Candidatus Kaiserbacteria bacterium]|nr:MAG: 50S ribosomal protein L18 [Candidatus Kaiserbacteria bacterium]PCI89901.1 MAG: 50S ribosomal protein L18 [Candidatus Kaiserbacteria bacterium]